MKKYFNVCRYCGAHLDPSEHCECRETATRFEKLTEESGGQLTFLSDTNEKSFWKIDRKIVK
jgi:hypothetical protein